MICEKISCNQFQLRLKIMWLEKIRSIGDRRSKRVIQMQASYTDASKLYRCKQVIQMQASYTEASELYRCTIENDSYIFTHHDLCHIKIQCTSSICTSVSGTIPDNLSVGLIGFHWSCCWELFYILLLPISITSRTVKSSGSPVKILGHRFCCLVTFSIGVHTL